MIGVLLYIDETQIKIINSVTFSAFTLFTITCSYQPPSYTQNCAELFFKDSSCLKYYLTLYHVFTGVI